MENTKLKRVKQQLKAAPRCPSWNPDLTPNTPKNSCAKSTSYLNGFPRCPPWVSQTPSMEHKQNLARHARQRQAGDARGYIQTYACTRAVKASAPHLKYGLFNTRRPIGDKRNLCQKSSPLRINSPISRNFSSFRQEKIKESKGRIGLSPVFIYPASSNKLVHQLSLSEVTHVDIMPRKQSPTYIACTPYKTPTPGTRSPGVI
ncbi:uncharacterized protein LOC142985554 [Anticarsia gemmatalis]|uniref:uncharacterized protein LOC142985554 n=1 Tax=Anticarsia gemmatalis TaxID=129554 RepID=UPI003F75E8E3